MNEEKRKLAEVSVQDFDPKVVHFLYKSLVQWILILNDMEQFIENTLKMPVCCLQKFLQKI